MRLIVLLPLLAVASKTLARPQDSLGSPSTESNDKTISFRHDTQERTNKAANPAIRDSMKIVANQLIDLNTTADFTMDTRTPPKVRLQQKNNEKKKQEALENSHPGVAIPVEIDAIAHESTTQKRVAGQKNENKRPTTDSGLSTWILLSEPSTTLKPAKKTTQKTTTQATTEKATKATVKVKPTVSRKTTTVPTEEKPSTKLMTKIKASVFNNAISNKNKTTPTPTTTTNKIQTTAKPTTTINTVSTPLTVKTTTMKTTVKTTASPPTKKAEKTTEKTQDVTAIDSSALPLEAKDDAVELNESNGTTKRPSRPTNKRKKNKTRRRKPSASNSTKIAQKEKPIGTQIYNYLSREVMPTVGVGLVGLMVTAGLASYFFSPFGGLRRAYEGATDRKDQYIYDEYGPGGVAEEEMIGKVIAGMPTSSDYTYKSPSSRNDYYRNEVSYKYRTSDYNPYANDYQATNVGSRINYGGDIIEKETGYTVDDNEYNQKQFVVGSLPKDYMQVVTPAAVPEHGPRKLRFRREIRKLPVNDEENELDNNFMGNDETTARQIETTIKPEEMTPAPVQNNSFFTFMKSLIELKVKLGLDLLQKTTQSFSRYLQGVQERVNNVFPEHNKTIQMSTQ